MDQIAFYVISAFILGGALAMVSSKSLVRSVIWMVVSFVGVGAGVDADPKTLVADVIARVREQIGPVAAFKQACVVSRLPKTRSGKILRGTMRKIADSETYRTPPTIEDPSSLDEIRTALEGLGYAKKS